MKITPDNIFIKLAGIMFVIQSPAKIAIPSTTKKANITPSNKFKCSFVFEDKRKTDS